MSIWAALLLLLGLVGGPILLFWLLKQWCEERAALLAIGCEMKCEFEAQLTAIVPHIYHRPTRVMPSVEMRPRAHLSWSGSRQRILLTVALTSAEDLERVRSMLELFVEEYQAKPGNGPCLVHLFFTIQQRIQTPISEEKSHHDVD